MKKIDFIIALLLFLFSFVPGFNLFSQDEGKATVLSRLYDNDIEQYFTFNIRDRALINELTRIISIDKVDPSGKVYAYANREEFSRFLDYGIDYRILPHPGNYSGDLHMKNVVNIRELQDWDFYPTYDAYVSMMNQFETDYPSLCQVFSIGTSVMGRELLVAKISDNVGLRENEPQVLYTSSIHGDELTGYVLMLRLIDYLLSNYGTDPKVTDLVNNVEIWINPLANPDGTYHGGNNSVNGAIRYNANGVDLNRNYPDPEDGLHPDGNAWQPETQNFMNMAEENRFVSSINFHGGSVVCNYPWDTWSKLAADDDWWQYVCHQYADTVHENCPWGYMTDFNNGITNGYQWYTISGGRQDYMNYYQQCREFTLEMSGTKLLQPDSLPYYWDYNYHSFLNYIEQSTFGLRGTVKDSVTGFPINAEVYVVLHEKDSSWVYTDMPNGNYHRLLYSGTYSVRFSSPDYNTKTIPNVTVVNGQATILNVELLPTGVGGIANNRISSMISVYPNPLHGNRLYLESSVGINMITIYNAFGEQVKILNPANSSGVIDLPDIPAGQYFIKLDTDHGPGMKKLMILQ